MVKHGVMSRLVGLHPFYSRFIAKIILPEKRFEFAQSGKGGLPPPPHMTHMPISTEIAALRSETVLSYVSWLSVEMTYSEIGSLASQL